LGNLHRLLAILFLLANQPEAEKKLEHLGSLISTTKESIKSIKEGLDNFHAVVMSIAQSQQAGNKTGQEIKTKPTADNEEPTAKPYQNTDT
jgi:hypothetical protein